MIKPQIVNKLKSINELQLLMLIANVDTWQHSLVTRAVTASLLDIAQITLKVTLKKLVDRGFVVRTAKGIYKINKEILQ